MGSVFLEGYVDWSKGYTIWGCKFESTTWGMIIS